MRICEIPHNFIHLDCSNWKIRDFRCTQSKVNVSNLSFKLKPLIEVENKKGFLESSFHLAHEYGEIPKLGILLQLKTI